MNLVQRVTNILTQPRPEWVRIDQEPATVGSLFTGYAMILAALPALAGILGSLGGLGIVGGIVTALLSYALSLAILYVMGLIANALAPSFGGIKGDIAAMKLVVYSSTPVWVVGILTGLLSIIPILGAILGFLLIIAAYAYAAYLMYLGSTVVMRVPQQQAIVYTLILVAIWFVMYLIIAAIVGAVVFAIVGAAMLTGATQYR